MPSLLVRVMRLASWEQQSVDDICDVEFGSVGPYSISVYEAVPSQLVRVYAEHQASDKVPRQPRNGSLIDLSGTPWPSVPTIGDTLFPFTKQQHREINVGDRAQLAQFVTHVLGTLDGRCHDISKASVKAHVADAHKAGDLEWATLCASRGSWGKLLNP